MKRSSFQLAAIIAALVLLPSCNAEQFEYTELFGTNLSRYLAWAFLCGLLHLGVSKFFYRNNRSDGFKLAGVIFGSWLLMYLFAVARVSMGLLMVSLGLLYFAAAHRLGYLQGASKLRFVGEVFAFIPRMLSKRSWGQKLLDFAPKTEKKKAKKAKAGKADPSPEKEKAKAGKADPSPEKEKAKPGKADPSPEKTASRNGLYVCPECGKRKFTGTVCKACKQKVSLISYAK
jgi:hypothetical protein